VARVLVKVYDQSGEELDRFVVEKEGMVAHNLANKVRDLVWTTLDVIEDEARS
jgi:hypothetical protein